MKKLFYILLIAVFFISIAALSACAPSTPVSGDEDVVEPAYTDPPDSMAIEDGENLCYRSLWKEEGAYEEVKTIKSVSELNNYYGEFPFEHSYDKDGFDYFTDDYFKEYTLFAVSAEYRSPSKKLVPERVDFIKSSDKFNAEFILRETTPDTVTDELAVRTVFFPVENIYLNNLGSTSCTILHDGVFHTDNLREDGTLKYGKAAKDMAYSFKYTPPGKEEVSEDEEIALGKTYKIITELADNEGETVSGVYYREMEKEKFICKQVLNDSIVLSVYAEGINIDELRRLIWSIEFQGLEIPDEHGLEDGETAAGDNVDTGTDGAAA